MRILMVTGDGGAGVSTLAVSAALAAAEPERPVLLLSTAGPLPDVFGAGATRGPVEPVRTDVPGVWTVAPGALQTSEALAAMLDPAGSLIRPAELPALPWARELGAMLALHTAASSGRFGLTVVDAGPTDRALELLAAPDALRLLLGRLPVPAAPGLSVAFGAMGAGFAGAATHLVMRAGPTGLARACRAQTALALHGCPVTAAWFNRLGGQHEPETRGARAALGTVVYELPAPLAHGEPAALAELHALLPGDDGRPSAAGAPVSVDEERYRLDIALPHTGRDEVQLLRSGDDLVLTVRQVRRRMPLSPVLRRCRVTGARLDGGVLSVEFTPDGDLWPQWLPAPGAAARAGSAR